MRAPRGFDWLLRRVLPPDAAGESIRGDLLEELAAAGDTGHARRRFRWHVMSLVCRYALQRRHDRTMRTRRHSMDSLRQDLKFAVRSLVKRPSFALMVVATLALGIGANTAIFSLVRALVLRSLPVSDPARLVVVTRNDGNQVSQQYPLFRHFAAHSTTLEGIVAFRSTHARLATRDRSERVRVALVSGSYFRVLGVGAALGALIADEDDSIPESGGPSGPVAVLGYGLWQRQFAGQPDAIGTSIMLNGRAFTVIGVAPPEFSGTEAGETPDVFAPLTMVGTLMPGMGSALTQPLNNWLRIIGRLKPDTEVRQAEAELTTLLRPYYADVLHGPATQKLDTSYRQSLVEQRVTLLPGNTGHSSLRRRYAQPLAVLTTVMALVLLVACANVANLTLSRVAARRQELAIRLGLGASRARLVSQLLLESVLLAGAGASVGLLLARWGRDILLTYLPVGLSVSAPLDWTVLCFTLALACGSALLFGLVPAFQSTNVDVVPALRDGGPGKSARVPLRKGLVIGQVSVSLVVVIGAVLFLRSLQALLSIDTGFARQNVLVASIDVPSGRAATIYQEVVDAARGLPGVLAAGTADSGPLGTSTGWTIHVPNYVPRANEPRSSPWVGVVSPDYFKTMMVPFLAGRDFDSRDIGPKTPTTMIVNETFAKHYFGVESPVGRMVGLDRGASDIEIVGVVKDTKYTGLREEPVRMVYVPFKPGSSGAQFALHVRTAGDPAALVPLLRQKVMELDRSASIFDVRTAEEAIGRSLLRERLLATSTMLFGGLALLLAAIGLYGVLSYGVAQRTREFGIRMAVGAEGRRIVWLVMREATWVVGVGIAVGLGAAWALGRLVSTLVYGVEAADPLSATVAVAVLVGASAAAAWLPARRASRVDPIRALRFE
jgi:predicted permease